MTIPCNLVNNTDKNLKVGLQGKANDKGTALNLLHEKKKDEWTVLGDLINITQKSRKRALFQAEALFDEKKVGVTVKGEAKGFSDTVTRDMLVVPSGFPYQLNSSGMLKADEEVTHVFTVPSDVVKESVKTSVCFYLSPLSNMTQALKALVRQPCGCFGNSNSLLFFLNLMRFIKNKRVQHLIQWSWPNNVLEPCFYLIFHFFFRFYESQRC